MLSFDIDHNMVKGEQISFKDMKNIVKKERESMNRIEHERVEFYIVKREEFSQ